MQCSRIHFTFTKFVNKLISAKNRIFISLVEPSDSCKTYMIHEWLKVVNVSIDTLNHSMMSYKKILIILSLSRCTVFEFINSLKNNGTKYCSFLMTHAQKFATLWTAGKHGGFSTIYIKHNLFHQCKLGRDVELQNAHIVLFMSPRYVHQVVTLSVQLGLGLALVDWYRDATSVPFGLLLIHLSPRTDDRLRYRTISGNIPSKFYVPDNLKPLKCLDDEHTKSLYSPSIPAHFPRMQS